jgi:phosphodiesterase/alkaline phosphatase D-like protein
VIAADMPLGLIVGDGKDAQGRDQFENSSNGDGPVLGREFEIADILRSIKRNDVENVGCLTADVHYCAAHYYDPAKAQFKAHRARSDRLENMNLRVRHVARSDESGRRSAVIAVA